jgi:hypothetical protein
MIYKLVLTLLVCMMSSNAWAYYAIAIVETDDGAWGAGYSYNADNRKDAEADALRRCHAHGLGRCRIIAFGRNGCFALAIGNETNGHGSGYNYTSAGGAASRAIVECTSSNPAGCSIKANVCDTTDGFEPESMTAAERRAMDDAFRRAAYYRTQRRAREQNAIEAQNAINGMLRGMMMNSAPRVAPPPTAYAPVPSLRPMPAPAAPSAPTRQPSDPCQGPIACAGGLHC